MSTQNETDKPTTAVQAAHAPQLEAQRWLASQTTKLSSVMPKTATPERIYRIACNAIARNPKLCLAIKQNPESLLDALIKITQLGIEVDGRRAALVPFHNRHSGKLEVQGIVMYQGLVELVRGSGTVSNIHADVVYSNDEFSFQHGTSSRLHHIPKLSDRGEPIAAYSFCKMKDGSEDFQVMGIEEVDSIRMMSPGGFDRDMNRFVGVHAQWPDEMRKKTVFRRHVKWLTLSPEVQQALEADDDIDPAMNVVKNVTPSAERVKLAVFNPPKSEEAAQPVREVDVLWELISGAGMDFDKFKEFCAADPRLSKKSEGWDTFDDIGSADYKWLLDNLVPDKKSGLKFKA